MQEKTCWQGTGYSLNSLTLPTQGSHPLFLAKPINVTSAGSGAGLGMVLSKHELVVDSHRGSSTSSPRGQDHSQCKFRVNITCFSLLYPDWCDYGVTLLNACKVTFSALSMYSRQLASSHPWWWQSGREEQKTFKESYFLCSFQTPSCWHPPHPLPSPTFLFFAGASPLHLELRGSRPANPALGSPWQD